MTLGGMAAAVGLIIDDAIVMVEHLVSQIFPSRPAAVTDGDSIVRSAATSCVPSRCRARPAS